MTDDAEQSASAGREDQGAVPDRDRAKDDARRLPNDKTVMKETFAKAGLPAEDRSVHRAMHGWCPPDSTVYNEPQAEKAWSRLLALYGKALA